MLTAVNGDQAVREIQDNMHDFYDFENDHNNEIKDPPMHFDVVILDLNMPILDGYEACK